MSSVYAIRHPHGFFKIGMSQNPIKRYKNIQGCCPYELVLVYVLTVSDNARGLESTIHERLGEDNHRGEWFVTSQNKIRETFEKCVSDETCNATEMQEMNLKKSNSDMETPMGGFTTAADM